MSDIEIENLLNEIHNSELYFYEEPKGHKPMVKYRKSLTYLETELKLIRRAFKNEMIFELTPFGNRVIKKGGWIEYQRIETEKENRTDKKDVFDFKVSKFRYHTFWWFFAFALIGFGLSIYNFTDNLLPSEKIKKQEERIEQMESELKKLQISISIQKSLDSLRNSKGLNEK